MSAALAGALLMYLTDPDRGTARRAVVRDRSLHLMRLGWRWAHNTALGVANHTRGLVAERRASMCTVRPSDDVLAERVRSELGHVIRHPRRVLVKADAGWIELRGQVLSDEKEALVGAIKRIPGVFGVEEHLDEHGWMNGPVVSSDGR